MVIAKSLRSLMRPCLPPDSRILFVGAFLSVILLNACVVPPNISESKVLPKKELALLSLLKQGTDFSASGRHDLAEREFRKALKLNPTNPKIYNDLGFVLQAQARFIEAENFYRKGLKYQPKNVVLMDNLARTLYGRGNIGESIKIYFQVLDLYHSLERETLREQLNAEFTDAEFVPTYRSIAMAYSALGMNDEAACYSTLAYIIGSNIYEAGRHSRLLFSMNKEVVALSVLKNTFIARQGNVPPKILLDYGIALFLNGDYQLSKASLARVLQLNTGTRVDRRTARLLRLMILDRVGGGKKERETLFENLNEEDTRFCEQSDLDRNKYWPLRLAREIKTLQTELCDEEKQSFLSS